MEKMSLRAHHLLCIKNFVGKGYSDEFVKHMKEVIAELDENKDLKIDIVNGKDEICSVCPNYKHGLCDSEKHVNSFDEKVKELLKLNSYENLSYSQLDKLVEEKIFNDDKFSYVCGDCDWGEICHKMNLKARGEKTDRE